MESGCITISRASFQTVFPAHFQFIAAMNPCPCGYAGSSTDICQCNSEQIKRYLSRISGPLLDRIDMHVDVPRLPPEMLMNIENNQGEDSATVRKRVMRAHHYQQQRQGKYNTALTVPELDRFGSIEQEAQQLLAQIVAKFNLSARVYHRIVKVARTIADLAESTIIDKKHLSEALHYRCLDRYRSLV
jgi:magnesium chelatase family protein